ncbi:hypothetical protein OSB04_019539 [Centaurea solstitialis]|uniref:Reverse transcriptase Ty1/copia-type domain-containing protein n=1 Tax=Centaurea solstitialis TaxID=347529 RepID=A0AA38WG02_9ASTR|nr:hypothetical protein OSB04_019539 [Centaurea solstitialis]
MSKIEPKKVTEALADPFWVEAMQDELFQFERNNVWTLTLLPNGKVFIGTKWDFRNKKDENGVVIRNKARRLKAMRISPAYAAHRGFKVYQIDVKSSFLNGKLKEEVYVKQPLGFESEKYPKHVYFLDKALYGLKQSPRIEFEMSMMGELTFFFGLQVEQSLEGIFINQAKYGQDLLKKYKLSDVSPMRTPMATGLKLRKDLSGTFVECKLYKGMIGSLLYLTAGRLDIIFATCLCARFQSNPKESHLSAVKRILRYLKKTPTLGLWYPLLSGFDLLAYTDSDYGGCQVYRKSTSGSCHFLGGKLVSWSSKKQNCVSTSTAEAEYVAAANCCSQALWMQTQLRDRGVNEPSRARARLGLASLIVKARARARLLNELEIRLELGSGSFNSSSARVRLTRARVELLTSRSRVAHEQLGSLTPLLRDYGYTFSKIPILCDSKSAIAISANPVQHSKTKHIDIRYHFLKHNVEEEPINTKPIPDVPIPATTSVPTEPSEPNNSTDPIYVPSASTPEPSAVSFRPMQLTEIEFEMSMMGELKFFFGLQVEQSLEGIFINQAKYGQDLLKKYKLSDVSPMRTPMATGLKLHKDLSGTFVECKLYKGMIGSLLYLTAGRLDIIFATCLCARFQSNPKESHSKTKHIDIRYHFLKHNVEEGNVEMYFVNTEYQLADLFTKALDEKRFNFFVE